jgi:hypothetical protein
MVQCWRPVWDASGRNLVATDQSRTEKASHSQINANRDVAVPAANCVFVSRREVSSSTVEDDRRMPSSVWTMRLEYSKG